jgi:hypothetical protein
MHRAHRAISLAAFLSAIVSLPAFAQGKAADYESARSTTRRRTW